MNRLIDTAINHITNLQDQLLKTNAQLRYSTTQWVDVNERMPAPSSIQGLSIDVLIWLHETDMPFEAGSVAVTCYSERWGGWLNPEGNTYEQMGCTVTHWRPLPPPPQREGE